MAPALFVLFMYGEDYTVHCPSQPDHEKMGSLELGLYLLKIGVTCQVHGQDWTVHGITHYISTVSWTPPFITLSPMNLPELLPDKRVQQHLNKPTWKNLPQIKDLSIQKLKLSPETMPAIWDMDAPNTPLGLWRGYVFWLV